MLENVGVLYRRIIIRAAAVSAYDKEAYIWRSEIGGQHFTSPENHKNEDFSIFQKSGHSNLITKTDKNICTELMAFAICSILVKKWTPDPPQTPNRFFPGSLTRA